MVTILRDKTTRPRQNIKSLRLKMSKPRLELPKLMIMTIPRHTTTRPRQNIKSLRLKLSKPRLRLLERMMILILRRKVARPRQNIQNITILRGFEYRDQEYRCQIVVCPAEGRERTRHSAESSSFCQARA